MLNKERLVHKNKTNDYEKSDYETMGNKRGKSELFVSKTGWMWNLSSLWLLAALLTTLNDIRHDEEVGKEEK